MVVYTEKKHIIMCFWISTPDLPERLSDSAVVVSKSMEYIVFIAGGTGSNSGITNKVKGLRPRDLD